MPLRQTFVVGASEASVPSTLREVCRPLLPDTRAYNFTKDLCHPFVVPVWRVRVDGFFEARPEPRDVAPSSDYTMAAPSPLKVTVTGAAGAIGYALCTLIGSGGLSQSSSVSTARGVAITALDLPAAEQLLEALAMEMQDAAAALPGLAAPLVTTTDPIAAFRDAELCLLVGARPRSPGMERADLLHANADIFRMQGALIGEHAAAGVRVVVVGNPANTNAAIALHAAAAAARRHGRELKPSQFSALTRLDHLRAQGILAAKMGVAARHVRDIVVWGNHSARMVPDVQRATVSANVFEDGVSVRAAVDDDAWLGDTFVSTVQHRGAAVIGKRGASSAASAAVAICAHARDWLAGSEGRIVSMAVPADGDSYGIPRGLVFSVPVRCTGDGEYAVVDDFDVDDALRAQLDANVDELIAEAAEVGLSFGEPGAGAVAP